MLINVMHNLSMRELFNKIYLGFLAVFAGMLLWLFMYDLVLPAIFKITNLDLPPADWLMPVCAGLVIVIGYLYGKFFVKKRSLFYSLFLIYAATVSLSVVSDTSCARGGLTCDMGSPTFLFLIFYSLFIFSPLSLLYGLLAFKALYHTKKYLLLTFWILFILAYAFIMYRLLMPTHMI